MTVNLDRMATSIGVVIGLALSIVGLVLAAQKWTIVMDALIYLPLALVLLALVSVPVYFWWRWITEEGG